MEESETKTPKDVEVKPGWFSTEDIGFCSVCEGIHRLPFDGVRQCGKG